MKQHRIHRNSQLTVKCCQIINTQKNAVRQQGTAQEANYTGAYVTKLPGTTIV